MGDLRGPAVAPGALSARVAEVLGRYTSFPWPILIAQCRRVELDPENLTKEGLRRVLPHLVNGVARFTSPDNGERAEQELQKLL